jgi:nitrate reductase NapAB chaperone NapD
MLKIFKKIFHNPNKETIRIFEEKTKIDYDPTIFSSLTVLSLSKSTLKNLDPLLVFINLEILNLSNNEIQDINCLKELKRLKIVDLRFNQIEKIPLWVFDLKINIYWKRSNDEQEGIYLEGNPLNIDLIKKIKNYPDEKALIAPIKIKKEQKSIKIEQLIPLKRQATTIFLPQLTHSDFIDNFTTPTQEELKLNLSVVEYNKKYQIVDSKHQIFKELQYIILIIKETECCLNPPILETISKLYVKSKIFLIIENRDNKNITEKITFFKTYNKSINIIEVYHSFNKESNESIKKNIYDHLNNTEESNSLWKESWIKLRDEIEESNPSNIDNKFFQTLAKKYAIPKELREEIFDYLKKVGTIKEYQTNYLNRKKILEYG